MKINVEIDCTPQEARAAIGLPDLTPLHDKVMGGMLEAFDGKAAPEMMASLMRGWFPDGATMDTWRRMFTGSQRE